MLQKVQAYLQQYCHIHKDTPLLLAVSGGIDSVVLCELMYQLKMNFAIAHCNFQLRGKESDEDAVFVKNLATHYQVPFFETAFDTAKYAEAPTVSTQMAARSLRYDWFERIRKENNYHAIVTAHHQNDIIETILYNLTKGTGIAGLHGILPKNGYLVRPMLCLKKEEIIDFASTANLSFREDASNASTKYARNKIRHEVVPTLKELNPNVEHAFFENAQRLREVELLYGSAIEQHRKKLLVQKGVDFFISIAKLEKTIAPQTLLWECLKKFGFNIAQVKDILSMLHGASGKLFFSETHRLLKDRKFLIVSPIQSTDSAFFVIQETDRTMILPEYKLSISTKKAEQYIVENNPKIAALDLDKLAFPLRLRKWQSGDYFYPIGLLKKNGQAGKKKLKAYFSNKKMSLLEKEKMWILQDNEGHIIWLVGERIDDRFKVTSTTKKVYRLRMKWCK